MAVTLSVELNDAQQARIVALAAVEAPGATPAQVKAWAEQQCKKGLMEAVRELVVKQSAEAANVARRDEIASVEADFEGA